MYSESTNCWKILKLVWSAYRLLTIAKYSHSANYCNPLYSLHGETTHFSFLQQYKDAFRWRRLVLRIHSITQYKYVRPHDVTLPSIPKNTTNACWAKKSPWDGGPAVLTPTCAKTDLCPLCHWDSSQRNGFSTGCPKKKIRMGFL